MHHRLLPERLSEKVFDALDVPINVGRSLEEDALLLLDAYNKRSPSYAHKLSIVIFGNDWTGADFYPDKSCWYNTDMRYGTQSNFYDATVDALAVRLNLIPPFAEQLREQHLKGNRNG